MFSFFFDFHFIVFSSFSPFFFPIKFLSAVFFHLKLLFDLVQISQTQKNGDSSSKPEKQLNGHHTKKINMSENEQK